MNKYINILIISIICISCNQPKQIFLESKDAYFGLTPPGTTPEVFAPGIVSDTTWAEHCQMAISPKGDEIFFSVYTDIYKTEDGRFTEQLFHSKIENGIWTKPEIADFTSDNKYGGNGGPVFSLDGKKLFFYQRKPRDKYMYYVVKENGQWSKEPINVGKPYNTKTGEVATNWTPVFTNKGYAYKYNQHKWVILKYKYEGTQFSQPDTMRVHKDFILSYNVYVAPDESYYIFSGYNYNGFGDFDLYICFKDSNGKWSYPILMRDGINTEVRERFPVVSPDGEYLFFMRHTETQDIFWVSTKIFDKYKNESIEIMKNPPEFKAIVLKSKELNKYIGEYSCTELNYAITINKEGNLLKAQLGERNPVTIECYEKDKFKYDWRMLKFEFKPNENIMLLQTYNSLYEMKKQ